MRKAIQIVLILLLLAGLVVSILPAKYVPERWKPFVVTRGHFHRKPAEIPIPESKRSSVPVLLRLKLDKGTCKVTNIGPSGEVVGSMTMARGSWKCRLPAQSLLVLNAGQNTGTYYVFVGSQWHPFAPVGKVLIFVACASAMATILILRNKAVARMRRTIPRGRVGFVVAVVVVSGLLYSVVHELGHLITGVLLGAEPDEVVLTIFSGQQPHVSFNYLPPDAVPWMSAAGPLLPTFLALLLLGLWLIFARRLPWYIAVSLAVPGLLFLLGNLGLLVELFLDHDHMGHLAVHFGLSGIWRVVFELVPFFVTLIAYALFAYRLRQIRQT